MSPQPYIQPLPYQRRRHVFLLLFTVFIVAIPILYLYATGYRFDFTERGNIISTGGMFIAAERTGAEIYIDDELVRETRVFRRAFYAQSIEPGTHRVHVQKDGHHTWVKELPVYPHLVTEAQAFNVPIVPEARIITRWQTSAGTPVVGASSVLASTTQALSFATTTATSTHLLDTEYRSLLERFIATSSTSTPPANTVLVTELNATTSEERVIATSTKEYRGVRLFRKGEDVYARWIGPREEMPYYYCAEAFDLIGTSTLPRDSRGVASVVTSLDDEETAELLHPVQQVDDDQVCEPEIQLDRKGQTVYDFNFVPGSIDFVAMSLESGVYVVEIDDRAWQNMQPLILNEGLRMRVENDRIYVYDGNLIYEMILE